MMGKPIDCFVDFVQSAAHDRSPQELFVAIIVPVGIEFEQAVAHVLRAEFAANLRLFAAQIDADSGQNPRELLHVALRIAAIDAERMQFHQLAREVFVDAARC